MDDLVTLLVVASAVIVGLTLLVAPVTIFKRITRKHAGSWTHSEREYVQTGGAYRGTVVDLVRSPGMPEGLRGPCMWSLYMLVPAVVSFPVLAMGLLVESDSTKGLGPALVLGPAGLALAIAIFVVGLRMPRRRPGFSRVVVAVATWEIVHNLGVILAVALSSGVSSESVWRPFGLEGLGMVAVPYAIVSLAHAVYLYDAARLMKAAPAAVEAEEQVVYCS